MAAKKLLILTVSLLLLSGLVLAGQTIIQKGSVITDVFNATNLFVERVSGHLLKGNIDASGNIVKNLADPENPQDAATKAYVDAKARTGTKCDGTSNSTHKGENVACETKEIFKNPKKNANLTSGCSGYKVICDRKATADKWCQEEGYNESAGFVGSGEVTSLWPLEERWINTGCYSGHQYAAAFWDPEENRWWCVSEGLIGPHNPYNCAGPGDCWTHITEIKCK